MDLSQIIRTWTNGNAYVELFLYIFLAVIAFFVVFPFLQGTSESSEFVSQKLENSAKCESEFKSYHDLKEAGLLQRGDLIECERVTWTYDHWMIYVGGDDDGVIHLTTSREKGTEIRRDKLKDAVKSSKCRINNLHSSALERGLLYQ